MNDRGALGLDADADAGAGVLGGVMGDEGHVRGPVHPHQTPLQALFLDTGDNLAQHLVMGLVDDGLMLIHAKGGSQTDDHLVGSHALGGVAVLSEGHFPGLELCGRGSSRGGSGGAAHLFQNFFDYATQRLFIKRHYLSPLLIRCLPAGWRWGCR